MITRAEIFGATDCGMVRKNNEDNFICTQIWDDRHLLLAAIDGIGGYEGGEVAAEIARDTIVDYVGQADRSVDMLGIIKQAVVEANNEIVRRKESDGRLSQMGCVLTSAIIDLDESTISIAHVGDSRLYCYHDGVITKLSHDHSLVGYREEIGDLTEDEAMHHPQRNIIERSLGYDIHMFDDENFIDAAIFPIMDGQTDFVFCSDGLSDMLRKSEIASVLALDVTVEQAVNQLIADANSAGGKDNVTVVVARIFNEAEPVNDDLTDCKANDGESAAEADVDQKDIVDEKGAKDDSVAVDAEPEKTGMVETTFVPRDVEEIKDEADRKSVGKKDRHKRRAHLLLPWILVVVLLGVIAALVITLYVNDGRLMPAKEEPPAKPEIVEQVVENECDSLMGYRQELDSLMERRRFLIESGSQSADKIAAEIEQLDKRIDNLNDVLSGVMSKSE